MAYLNKTTPTGVDRSALFYSAKITGRGFFAKKDPMLNRIYCQTSCRHEAVINKASDSLKHRIIFSLKRRPNTAIKNSMIKEGFPTIENLDLFNSAPKIHSTFPRLWNCTLFQWIFLLWLDSGSIFLVKKRSCFVAIQSKIIRV